MKWPILAWCLWLAALASTIALDYALRLWRGLLLGGLPPHANELVAIVVAIPCVALLLKGTTKKTFIWRTPLAAVQVIGGFYVYFFAWLSYVCGAGIDCI